MYIKDGHLIVSCHIMKAKDLFVVTLVQDESILHSCGLWCLNGVSQSSCSSMQEWQPTERVCPKLGTVKVNKVNCLVGEPVCPQIPTSPVTHTVSLSICPLFDPTSQRPHHLRANPEGLTPEHLIGRASATHHCLMLPKANNFGKFWD